MLKKSALKDMEDVTLEKKEKENIKKNKYLGKDLYIIENGVISKITYKDLKENDFIIKYDQEIEFYIIDRDKRKIRPFVEDLLNQMNIETLQTKLIKASLVFIIILIFVNIMSFFIGFSSGGKTTKIIDIISKIEKIQLQCDKPSLIPNNNKDVIQ